MPVSVFVAGFRPLELRGEEWADVKKAHPGIQEKALWGAVDSNTATTVASQTAAALRAHPDITVVFAPYDEFARGVKLGAAEAGVADKVKVYSADVSTADIQEICEPLSSLRGWRRRPPIRPLSARCPCARSRFSSLGRIQARSSRLSPC